MTGVWLQAVSATTKQLSLVKLHEQSKKNLEQEIQNYKEEAQKQRKIIYQLEKERDRYINEASDLTQKVCHTVKSFLIVGHLILCISWVGQLTNLRSQWNIYSL